MSLLEILISIGLAVVCSVIVGLIDAAIMVLTNRPYEPIRVEW